jgi:hypothetical protein
MSSFSVAALISSRILLKDPFRAGESPSNLLGSPSLLLSLKFKEERKTQIDGECDKFLVVPETQERTMFFFLPHVVLLDL